MGVVEFSVIPISNPVRANSVVSLFVGAVFLVTDVISIIELIEISNVSKMVGMVAIIYLVSGNVFCCVITVAFIV